MPELIPGLVSITFRPLSPQQLIELVAKAGLKAIEWGGDVHVPHGDIARAKEVRRQTADSGLSVAAYGSYYRIGASEAKGLSFASVLDSAVALGAPTIRVWGGVKGSRDTTPSEREEIVADALRIADLAKEQGVTISLEYHADTLTDARDSARTLMEEITHPNFIFLWQTANGEGVEQNIARLHDVTPRMGNIHVFHWWPTGADRKSLVDGEDRWKQYLDIIRATGKSRAFLLEFVRGDSQDQFLEDAATLRRWLES